MTEQLASEQVILSSPTSFTGATKRIWRLTESPKRWLAESHTGGSKAMNWAAAILAFTGVFLLLVLAWVLVTGWYAVFFIFLVPWRLFRRSGRKTKKQELQHREMLAAIEAQKQE